MIKWYENLAKELNIPMIMIDIPFNPDYEVSDAQTEYIKAQFWDAIHQLEEITGKKVDLHNRVDPSCLGGIRLDYDGKRLDGTVQHRLDEIGGILKNTVL